MKKLIVLVTQLLPAIFFLSGCASVPRSTTSVQKLERIEFGVTESAGTICNVATFVTDVNSYYVTESFGVLGKENAEQQRASSIAAVEKCGFIASNGISPGLVVHVTTPVDGNRIDTNRMERSFRLFSDFHNRQSEHIDLYFPSGGIFCYNGLLTTRPAGTYTKLKSFDLSIPFIFEDEYDVRSSGVSDNQAFYPLLLIFFPFYLIHSIFN